MISMCLLQTARRWLIQGPANSPSISMLYSIAQALGVKVTHFSPRMTPGTKVVRADAREVFRFEGSFTVYLLLSTSFLALKLESLLV